MAVRVWIAALLLPLSAFAAYVAPPHDRNDSERACYYCHTLSVKTAGGEIFSSACLGCHQNATAFGMPWLPEDEAVAGVTGNQHNWSGALVNPAHGAFLNGTVPYLATGKLQCVVCHDMHPNSIPATANSMHTSIATGVGHPETGNAGAGSGSASMTLTAPLGSGARGFRLQIRTVSGGGGTFIMSHDFAFRPDSWLNWDGSAWVAGTVDGPGRAFTNGVEVDLDVPGVKVMWSAGAAVGDYWDFYIAYPFLRFSNVNDIACAACHAERVMNHVRARGDDRYYRPNGVRKFSHPVNVGLNANGFDTDRSTVLDADGTAGVSTTDGRDEGGNPVQNDANNLTLDGGLVRCTTCHAAHNADSNSLTVDPR